jgi:hypothetical protein
MGIKKYDTHQTMKKPHTLIFMVTSQNINHPTTTSYDDK